MTQMLPKKNAASSARLRYVSLFAGIEAGTAAFEKLGVDAVPVAFSEIDPAANAVLRHRWPHVLQTGGVKGFNWGSLAGKVDLVIGGPPCQSYSTAGQRAGSRDARGELVFDYLRAVGAMQPRWFVLENVLGLLSANKEQDFEDILQAIREYGYACAWTVLDTADFGVPQHRRRLWIVGELNGDGSGPGWILDLPPGTSGSTFESRTAWQTDPRRASGCTRTAIAGQNRRTNTSRIRATGQEAEDFHLAGLGHNGPPPEVLAVNLRNGTIGAICPTLMTKANSLNSNPCVLQIRDGAWALRRLTPRECLRLQGFNDNWLDGVMLKDRPLSDTARYRLIGNSWSVPVAAWLFERIVARTGATPSASARLDVSPKVAVQSA